MRNIVGDAKVSNWMQEFTNNNCDDADVDGLLRQVLLLIDIDRSHCTTVLVDKGLLISSLAYQSSAWSKEFLNLIVNYVKKISKILSTEQILIYSFFLSVLQRKEQIYKHLNAFHSIFAAFYHAF